MSLRLTFEFWGDRQVDRSIRRQLEAVADMRPAWDALASRFVALERRQFASEGAYGGAIRWSPLTPRYAAWKHRHYPGKTILRRTDDLYNSLTNRPLDVEVLEPKYMIVGSSVPYGRFHQRGEGIVRRPPVEFPGAERREWVKVVQRFLITGEVPIVGPRGGLRYGPPT